MIRLIKLLPIAIFILFVGSCKKDETPPPDPNITFKATLSGANEAPNPNASTATGNSTATFNTTTKILTVTTTYTGLTPTLGHVHKGAVGVAGGVIFPFTNLASPIVLTTPALDATQEADLMANLYYTNLHTAAFPGGEIRGQLIKQ